MTCLALKPLVLAERGRNRFLVIGAMAGLVPGDLVLDIGSACGHMARWFYEAWRFSQRQHAEPMGP